MSIADRSNAGPARPPRTIIVDSTNGSLPSLPSAVRVGGADKSALLQSLQAAGVRLNSLAEALFADSRFVPLVDQRLVEIAAVSVGALGFESGATYAQIRNGARQSSLVECPLELGPHLRLVFPDQPEDGAGQAATRGQAPPGSITIASPPLDESDETPKGFYLRRIDGEPWLRGYRASLDHVWTAADVFVFARSSD